MVKEKLRPIPNYADVMDVHSWDCCVKCGAFIPDDGNGYWCPDENYESDISCWSPRPEWATHVAWYNR
ncbi:hypothetical protein [Salmonella phage PVPSE1]|uniref:Uncharacterized protein 228 n=2 Tax=Seunavirus TaxID=1914851 RepID=G3BM94_9CAUD|nr:hypothetical protein PVP-SE1_gp228 [Salmonella phage PVPSE1]YP_009148897.1 hypothetical protein ACQ19_gp101 [Salmonella phage SSE121]ADP02624.1 hypothetical protein [Salmonella phage PVPSE1]AFU63742.1 hypothetical protein [Salmonella phage SSE121]